LPSGGRGLSYEVSSRLFATLATHVDKIRKSARAIDLPVQPQTRLELPIKFSHTQNNRCLGPDRLAVIPQVAAADTANVIAS